MDFNNTGFPQQPDPNMQFQQMPQDPMNQNMQWQQEQLNQNMLWQQQMQQGQMNQDMYWQQQAMMNQQMQNGAYMQPQTAGGKKKTPGWLIAVCAGVFAVTLLVGTVLSVAFVRDVSNGGQDGYVVHEDPGLWDAWDDDEFGDNDRYIWPDDPNSWFDELANSPNGWTSIKQINYYDTSANITDTQSAFHIENNVTDTVGNSHEYAMVQSAGKFEPGQTYYDAYSLKSTYWKFDTMYCTVFIPMEARGLASEYKFQVLNGDNEVLYETMVSKEKPPQMFKMDVKDQDIIRFAYQPTEDKGILGGQLAVETSFSLQ
ncbi:MAG: hypothetical protein IK130_03830 [Oscillospiraceae bacterium]|nr:hypothetical protein [Oscillospiraceae bacterium]